MRTVYAHRFDKEKRPDDEERPEHIPEEEFQITDLQNTAERQDERISKGIQLALNFLPIRFLCYYSSVYSHQHGYLEQGSYFLWHKQSLEELIFSLSTL